jgi:hypothetical protein
MILIYPSDWRRSGVNLVLKMKEEQADFYIVVYRHRLGEIARGANRNCTKVNLLHASAHRLLPGTESSDRRNDLLAD